MCMISFAKYLNFVHFLNDIAHLHVKAQAFWIVH